MRKSDGPSRRSSFRNVRFHMFALAHVKVGHPRYYLSHLSASSPINCTGLFSPLSPYVFSPPNFYFSPQSSSTSSSTQRLSWLSLQLAHIFIFPHKSFSSDSTLFLFHFFPFLYSNLAFSTSLFHFQFDRSLPPASTLPTLLFLILHTDRL